MYILGINDNHDSSAALFKDNKLLFAVSEERLIRKKLTRIFPSKSIKECLNFLKETDPKAKIDKVIMGSKYTPAFILRLFDKQYDKRKKDTVFSFLLRLYVLYQSSIRTFRLSFIETFFSSILIKKRLKTLGLNIKLKDILFEDHHKSHAASAYFASGYNKALIITLDSMGDGVSFSVSTANKGRIKRIFCQSGRSSVTFYYSMFTELLLFRPGRHEGKITGLAAYGNSKKTIGFFRKMMRSENGKFTKSSMASKKKIEKFVLMHKKEDIAAGLQKNFEDQITSAVVFWAKKTKNKNICLAGGAFANVKLNFEIHKKGYNVFIFPAMGDSGLAIGSVYQYLSEKNRITPKKIKDMYLGPKIADNYKTILKKNSIVYEDLDDTLLTEKAASLLALGKTVALARGRMEFGPRALGNRSILVSAKDKGINESLNKKLKRTEFMPFAPVILKEHANSYLKSIKGADHASEFMTICFKTKPAAEKNCPAIVHIDKTARPQILNRKTNPFYYDLLNLYYKKTKVPAIINTSFNMHEEPMVCSAEDAIRAFSSSKLDYLILENSLISYKKNKESLKRFLNKSKFQ